MHLDELSIYHPQFQQLLSGMSDDIKSRCIVKKFNVGSTVVKKQDRFKHVYIVVKGELKVINEFENGSIYAFGSILPLGFIGELEALAEECEYAATIKAISECVTVHISPDDFYRWIESDHTALLAIAKGVAKKAYPTSYENGNILFQPCIQKIQSYIVKYCNQKFKEMSILKVGKKRQQIADEVGSSVKSVNRSVKKLEKEGLITIKKGKIYVSKNQYSRLIETTK